MFIVKKGRGAFLEFLRNLTPQILLLSMAFFMGGKLNFDRFDFNNTAPTIIFFVFLMLGLLAGWINAMEFFGKFTPMKRMSRGLKLIRQGDTSKRLRAKSLYAVRQLPVLGEGAFIFFTVEFASAGVVLTAVATANKMSI